MSNPLFASGDQFDIIIKYMIIKTRSGNETVKVFDLDKQEDKDYIETHPDKVKELVTTWIQPNWKQSQELLQRCMFFDDILGRRDVNWPKYRAATLDSFIKSWDILDTENNPVPCNKENIDKLDPQVGSALVDAFFNKTHLTEEELGN